MIILFIGVQGSGKGTQAKVISKKLGIAHISTGDLLRSAKGELREKIDSYINKGQLVPDEFITEILKQRIKDKDCKKGFILDGFPRNLNQVKKFSEIGKIDKIVEIYISDKTAKKRLMGRWNCKKCGIAYNIVTEPKPKNDKICDVCNLKLFQREDDADEKAIEKRLEIYYEGTKPILDKFKSIVIRINGEQDIKKITEDIMKIFKISNS